MFLQFLRDSAITFWNYAQAKCGDDIEIKDLKIINGIERLIIDKDVCRCLTEKLPDNWKFKKCTQTTLEHLSSGKLYVDSDKIYLILGKLEKNEGDEGSFKDGMDLFKMFAMKDVTRFIKDKLLYSYARGFPVFKDRSFEKNDKSKNLKAQTGSFYLLIEGFSHGMVIKKGMYLGKIKGSDSYLLMADIVLNKELVSEFVKDEYEDLKSKLANVVKTFKGNDAPIIQDIMYERVLLEVVSRSLSSSIAYALSWPTLRLYINTRTSLIIMEFPSTVFDIAKASVIESAEQLDMTPRELVNKVIRLIDNGIQGEVLTELYTLAGSVLQGRPDIDLLIKLERAEISESRT